MSYTSPSPPPLRHPVPTHPAYIPEPPSTPASPQGYQRFSSTPDPQQQHQHLHPQQQYAHVPAYGAPYQMVPPQQQHMHHQPQQHIQHQQQQQQQQQPQQPASFIPAFGIPAGQWSLNDSTAQFGLQLGSSAVAAGQEYVQRNFGGNWVSSMKKNFDVSNGYVINKLRLVLFPWRHKPWSRKVLRAEQGVVEWQTPRDDINCPDLYIPLMAFATYSLIAAFKAGVQERFDPRVLGETASRAVMVTFLDFLFVYGGCYFLNVQSASKTVTDLIAYAGYKFVGVILLITSSFVGIQGVLWYMIFGYCFAANAFFLLRSLRSVVLPDPASNPNATTVGQSQKRRRITFLFLEAVFCQIVWMGILVRV